ncbi:hypothetical protein AALP_AA7G274100 [Arabis alpina]|uniref:F-box domain-containing protein n=1 Tax=Arabis alpina TaxID=50452 RepID=A0A087GKX5_ARAAL|nr:hypothetical protein AALP_AA7G274100 [Arabis alpina]
MSSTVKKKRKTKKNKELSPILLPSPESTPNPSLPDDLLISCFARVSRLYYPTLSFVSKSFGSLIASPELYKTRSLLNRTESCLYVYLRFHPDPTPYWYTLCRRPNPNITNDISIRKNKKKPCGYVLAAIQAPHSPPAPPAHWAGLVSVGSNIYNIGGPIVDKEASSRVSILDCRSQTWLEGPKMQVERKYPAANVIDGKIYVVGGCKDCDKSNWMEVFDTKTQVWELVSSPGAKICGDSIHKSAVIDEKVYVFGNCNGLALKPKDGTWQRVGWEMESGWAWYSYNVIGNVLYYYNDGGFKWYDTKVRVWRNLMGVKGLPRLPNYIARLADHGGKMAVLWDRKVPSSEDKKKTIWCAVIALERRNNDEEIWGKVEWYDAVLAVPESCRIEYAISATL